MLGHIGSALSLIKQGVNILHSYAEGKPGSTTLLESGVEQVLCQLETQAVKVGIPMPLQHSLRA